MTQEERRLFLTEELLKERGQQGAEIPKTQAEQRLLLRALMNVRRPAPASSRFIEVLDVYLRQEIAEKGITNCMDIPEIQKGICVWQGDITALRCDAIVNAANSGMTGCYYPNHRCIDNCIHTFAGIGLRRECDELMRHQGHEEQTGGAKVTGAYNLPCRHIIHTVGPIAAGSPTAEDCRLLARCYRSCLEAAEKIRAESIAFCCISTGEFGFPNERAAEIATGAVRGYMERSTCIRRVIFNVFKDIDKRIYLRLLG